MKFSRSGIKIFVKKCHCDSFSEPMSRAISVYYFWGELFKMVRSKSKSQLGSSEHQGVVRGSFLYHGNEYTPPPPSIALDYAVKLPYRSGMPGPSYISSAFASRVSDAVDVLRSGRVLPIVTERLDESLVALAFALKWSLSDVVITMHRKSLSPHPSSRDWPQDAIAVLNNTLSNKGEFDIYRESNLALNRTLTTMISQGVNIDQQVMMLRQLRERVTTVQFIIHLEFNYCLQLCLQDPQLEKYKRYLLKKGVPPHPKGDKLRDVPSKYITAGHGFSLYTQLFFSFDLCGACEAAAMEISIDRGYASNVANALQLPQLLQRDASISSLKHFEFCPVYA